LELCRRLNYLDDNQISSAVNLCDEIGKILYVLIKKLSNNT